MEARSRGLQERQVTEEIIQCKKGGVCGHPAGQRRVEMDLERQTE